MRPRRLAIASTVMAAGGAALGWAADRRARRGQDAVDDPEWQELRQPLRGRPQRVESSDGTALHVEVLGPGRGRAAGARALRGAPTLVFAHGYALSQDAWHYQRRDLCDEFRLVLYDQRGHGRSQQAAAGDYSIEALGADLAAVVAAAVPHDRRAVLVGHSLGGMAILSYVRQLPQVVAERVVGAVFIDTTGSDVLTGAVVSTGVAAVSAMRSRLTRAAFGGRGSGSLSLLLTRTIGLTAQARPAHVAFTEQLLVECPNTVKAALGPLLTSLDLRDAAPLATMPALVLVGERDRLTPLAQARRLAEALPDAQLIQLPGVGHMAPLEAHEAVSGQLRAFARRLTSAAGVDAVAERR